MPKGTPQPTLVKDLGALADLYRTVFWMMGQRIQHGRTWQERLERDVIRPGSRRSPETERSHSRQ